MRCSKCGAELKDGVLFCRDCGAKVEKIRKKRFCIECGAEYSEGTRFCTSCGANLALQGPADNVGNSINYTSEDSSTAEPAGNSLDNSINAEYSNSDTEGTSVPYGNGNDCEETTPSNDSVGEAENVPNEDHIRVEATGSSTKDFKDAERKEKTVSMSGAAKKRVDNSTDSIEDYISSIKPSIQQILSQDGTPFDKFKKIILTIWTPLDAFCRVVAAASTVAVLVLIISVITHRGIFQFIIQAAVLAIATLLHKGRIKTSNPKLKYFVLALAILLIFTNARSCFANRSSARSGSENTVVNDDSEENNENPEENSGLSKTIPTISEDQETNADEGIHSYSIKNYVGKNLASFGRKKGDYMVDEYGYADLRLIYKTSNGAYIDPDDIEDLKDYVVVDQNIDSTSKFVLVNMRDSDGKPYSSLVSYQNYEEIVLFVTKVGEDSEKGDDLTRISPTLDRHEWYVRDYTGRNIASFGTMQDDKRVDEYGYTELDLIFISEDGSYIDPKSSSDLRQYVVTSQETEPNTSISICYMKHFDGSEYDNLVESQSLEEIVLHVQKLDESIIAQYKDLAESNTAEENAESSETEKVTEDNTTSDDNQAVKEGEKAAVPADAYEYKNEDYKDVKESLSEAGFTNITTKKQYDIFFGWTKEGEVASVSIDGKTDFEEGDLFKKDAKIVIAYHLKYRDDPDNHMDEEAEEMRKDAEDLKNEGKEFLQDVAEDIGVTAQQEDNTGNESDNDSEKEVEKEREKEQKPETVSYSTNTKDTVKDGNSGAYSYIKQGPQYDQYYIIDFDEGYVYSFDQGSSEDCDRLKIESGDLKSGVTITYHAGGDEWSYKLYFEDKGNPEHLIMMDNDDFTYDYYSTDLSEALTIKDSKYITDY